MDLSWSDDPDDQYEGLGRRIANWFVPSTGEARGLVVVLVLALGVTATLLIGTLRRDAGPPPDPSVAAAASAAGPTLELDAEPGAIADERDGSLTPVGSGPVVAHVTGAVLAPGLVTVSSGARVGDAIEAAGGLDEDADLERINLARTLTDGEHVHVPRFGEDPVGPAGSSGTPPSSGAGAGSGATGGTGGAVLADGRLDINRASVEDLDGLPGIGPAKAAAIVEDRERNGPFREPGDLRRVSGIGEATFQRLAELIAVG